jgi:hypothetical protein
MENYLREIKEKMEDLFPFNQLIQFNPHRFDGMPVHPV